MKLFTFIVCVLAFNGLFAQQVYVAKNLDYDCDEQIIIMHDNNYSHLSINNKIYHVVCKEQSQNDFIKITIQRDDEKKILFIGSNVIELRGENFSFSEVYKILKYI